ncbi:MULTISPECIES: hypothetical protein [unclassified Micromonospora]|uniref:hypothetical protein n=1 Tax=unclassified Micromonospora TaxID=2617518 RepID=UPI00249A977A|nr:MULTISPECIES: hypothetical protein [unclassified Micromonospora]WFE50562.1 hypothetical protein O7617_09605 [Micromonospora sp. WMMD1155]WFF02604.1 hypothetical protein O7616_07565 [Micromonospora sp. WMMD964]
MAKQQISEQQQKTERARREQEPERNQDFGDQAASARLPDDPKAAAPRDAIGRPSTGEPV